MFQPVDGGVNRVCRGANFTDDSPEDYVLHKGTTSLSDCMRLCMMAPVCKGIEFSAKYNDGHCEVWTRASGINATAPVRDFMCLRYGAVQEKFDLINGASSNRVCRGDSPDDNSEAYYILRENVPTLSACKDLCVAEPDCKGIEYNEALQGGRCEVWTRTAGISATLAMPGFTCLRYGMQEMFKPVDGGENRVCRGASPIDISPSYYVVHNNTATMDDCKKLCTEAPVCKGIEYSSGDGGGRCEVWTRVGGIRATFEGNGSVCFRYGGTELFIPIGGGGGRACRGGSSADDSPKHYILHTGIPSLDDCKRLCERSPTCKGIEYNRVYDNGRCEVWTRPGGITATSPMRNSECLRYGTTELFWPVDGWADQACRGATEKDDSPAYYELHVGVASLAACKTLCISTVHCRGVEYTEHVEGGRCEVWTRVGGILATHPANGTRCFQYGEHALDAARDHNNLSLREVKAMQSEGPADGAPGVTRASRRRSRAVTRSWRNHPESWRNRGGRP
uniref:Apple domain-containing protein n=1 Tax=Alexandrium catenella TaxID=2925 RepID=A0A7S1SEB0_ALECA